MKNKTYNKKKMLVVFSTAVVLIFSLMARLFYLMVFDAEHYQKLAKDLHERERKIKAARGGIAGHVMELSWQKPTRRSVRSP